MNYTSLKNIERSIITTYRKTLWKPFIQGIIEFDLINENDNIAVCISGGKDSLLLAKLLQELQVHGNKKFGLKFIALDPGFNEENRLSLQNNCDYLNIPVLIKETDIFAVTGKISANNPCYLCARMRRGGLYAFAKELGCNKIALGHHFDDVIETVLLNTFYAGTFKTMLPKLKSTNFENIELIRPLYFLREKNIINYTLNTKIPVMNCGCTVASKKTSSKRQEIKELISTLKKINPDVDKCILKSTYNVHIDSVIGYKQNDEYTHFLDNY